jgi:hypothetical protein
MINYQAMPKSQSIEYNDWLVSHSKGLIDYEDFPDTLKTTICPNCLMASNEYSFGVDNFRHFSRTVAKNKLLIEMYKKTVVGRFRTLVCEFETLEEECAVYDRKKGKPSNMRSRATLEKIWNQQETYAESFFTLLFADPRDCATALVCFAMDRYCQMLRIGHEYGIPYDPDAPSDVHSSVKKFFESAKLEMKTAQPRLFYIAANYHQCVQLVNKMAEDLSLRKKDKYEELKKMYHQEAFDFFRYSEASEDMTVVPLEFKEGGMAYLLCRFYWEVGNEEEARKWLRAAKRYADSKLRRIVSMNQQNFVNWVDDLYKEMFDPPGRTAVEDPTRKTTIVGW